MKNSLKFLSLIFLFTLPFSQVNAQRGPGGAKGGKSPEERAQAQTGRMTEHLSLSEKQAEKVGEINLKYAQQLKDARQNFEGDDRSSLRTTMHDIRTKHEEELSTVLTSEQFEQFKVAQEEMRQNRGKRKGGKKGMKPKPEEGDQG